MRSMLVITLPVLLLLTHQSEARHGYHRYHQHRHRSSDIHTDSTRSAGRRTLPKWGRQEAIDRPCLSGTTLLNMLHGEADRSQLLLCMTLIQGD